jgi:hypothetical protein
VSAALACRAAILGVLVRRCARAEPRARNPCTVSAARTAARSRTARASAEQWRPVRARRPPRRQARPSARRSRSGPCCHRVRWSTRARVRTRAHAHTGVPRPVHTRVPRGAGKPVRLGARPAAARVVDARVGARSVQRRAHLLEQGERAVAADRRRLRDDGGNAQLHGLVLRDAVPGRAVARGGLARCLERAPQERAGDCTHDAAVSARAPAARLRTGLAVRSRLQEHVAVQEPRRGVAHDPQGRAALAHQLARSRLHGGDRVGRRERGQAHVRERLRARRRAAGLGRDRQRLLQALDGDALSAQHAAVKARPQALPSGPKPTHPVLSVGLGVGRRGARRHGRRRAEHAHRHAVGVLQHSNIVALGGSAHTHECRRGAGGALDLVPGVPRHADARCEQAAARRAHATSGSAYRLRAAHCVMNARSCAGSSDGPASPTPATAASRAAATSASTLAASAAFLLPPLRFRRTPSGRTRAHAPLQNRRAAVQRAEGRAGRPRQRHAGCALHQVASHRHKRRRRNLGALGVALSSARGHPLHLGEPPATQTAERVRTASNATTMLAAVASSALAPAPLEVARSRDSVHSRAHSSAAGSTARTRVRCGPARASARRTVLHAPRGQVPGDGHARGERAHRVQRRALCRLGNGRLERCVRRQRSGGADAVAAVLGGRSERKNAARGHA